MDGYSDKIQRLVQEKDRMLIGGGWVRSRSGGGFSTNDPAREEKICEVPLAAGEDVELAVEAASGSSATWRKLNPFERAIDYMYDNPRETTCSLPSSTNFPPRRLRQALSSTPRNRWSSRL